jgi:hypothetical protein
VLDAGCRASVVSPVENSDQGAAFPRLGGISEWFVTPWLAILDIALVFIVLHGDLRIT